MLLEIPGLLTADGFFLTTFIAKVKLLAAENAHTKNSEEKILILPTCYPVQEKEQKLRGLLLLLEISITGLLNL